MASNTYKPGSFILIFKGSSVLGIVSRQNFEILRNEQEKRNEIRNSSLFQPMF